MTIEGLRGYNAFLCGAGQHCGPRSGVRIDGNSIVTPGYTMSLDTTNRSDSALTIRDKTGKVVAKIGGDPHALFLDKKGGVVAQGDFQKGPLTIKLPDGTKVTVVPTRNQGVNFISDVAVTNGRGGVKASYGADGNGNLALQALPGYGLDMETPDGVTLYEHGSGDLTLDGRWGQEVSGTHLDFDAYRSADVAHDRPGRIDLPHRGGWGGGISGLLHHARFNGDGFCGTPRINHLLNQLETLRWQAHHGSLFARMRARHEMARISREISRLGVLSA
jgi:hypothetical protein